MTDAEIYEMILSHADQIDASFEYWLTVSFGVLIAVHVLRAAFSFKLKVVLCALYVSASSIAVLFTVTDLMQLVAFTNELSFVPQGGVTNLIGSVIRMVVYFVGTASVAVAIFRYEHWVHTDDA